MDLAWFLSDPVWQVWHFHTGRIDPFIFKKYQTSGIIFKSVLVLLCISFCRLFSYHKHNQTAYLISNKKQYIPTDVHLFYSNFTKLTIHVISVTYLLHKYKILIHKYKLTFHCESPPQENSAYLSAELVVLLNAVVGGHCR